MAIFEGAHLNLLQGVSQQVPRSRLAGQLTSQVNMLSDPVTGLRRRSGSKYRFSEDTGGANVNTILAWRTDIAGVSCELLLNTHTGVLTIRNTSGEVLQTFPPIDYLKTTTAQAIRHTSVGESLFICNITKVPQGIREGQGLDPKSNGYFFVKEGAISKTYTVTVSNVTKGIRKVGTFTTPAGTAEGEHAQLTLDHIAAQLCVGIQEGGEFVTVREGGYVYVRPSDANRNDEITIISSAGTRYVGVSGGAHTRVPEDLPAMLPDEANGLTMSTGMDTSYVYYSYNAARAAWLEVGEYGGVSKIENMPVEVYWDDGWKMEQLPFEGRPAGDSTTNPDPEFVDWGITGMSSYQGRLVLLAGPWVLLSATNHPYRFYRSTVHDLLDDDPISIGSSSATSAAFAYAITFNKDLILFSSEYQALVPSGNQALSPRNAQIQVTSTHGTDLLASPISAGRTVLFPSPRSSDYFGMMEMVPSPYTDAQYVSTDSTEHLPRYMQGRCRFIVSSSVAGIVLIGPSGDLRSLIVHEYSWDGDEKVLRAWHRWTFPFEIASAYFSEGLINLVTVRDGTNVDVLTVDPRVGVVDSQLERRPFLDAYMVANVVDGEVTLPTHLQRLPEDLGDLVVGIAEGPLAGTEIGYDIIGNKLRLNRSISATKVHLGFRYESSFSPSPPIIKDQSDFPIGTNRMTLRNYWAIVEDTGTFEVMVHDVANREEPNIWEISPTRYTSPELQLGHTPVSGEIGVVVPCRVNANTSVVEFRTDGLGELRVLALEYIIRTIGKIQRIGAQA